MQQTTKGIPNDFKKLDNTFAISVSNEIKNDGTSEQDTFLEGRPETISYALSAQMERNRLILGIVEAAIQVYKIRASNNKLTDELHSNVASALELAKNFSGDNMLLSIGIGFKTKNGEATVKIGTDLPLELCLFILEKSVESIKDAIATNQPGTLD